MPHKFDFETRLFRVAGEGTIGTVAAIVIASIFSLLLTAAIALTATAGVSPSDVLQLLLTGAAGGE